VTGPGGPGFFDGIAKPPVDARGQAPELTDVDRDLASLAEHPGWKILAKRVAEHEAAWGERLASLITKSDKDLDQKKLTETRGYFKGQRNIVGAVEHAQTAVALEKAQGRKEGA
jgi:hypothetical protein